MALSRPTSLFSRSWVCAAGERSKALLETSGQVWLNRRLPGRVAAGRFGSGLTWLADPEHLIQQLVRILRTCVLRDHQQDAPVGCFKDSQQPPGSVQIETANVR